MKKYLLLFSQAKENVFFCFPKQNKIFDFVSASKNNFRFLFPQINISSGLFPQVKILLLAETKTKNTEKTESISILFCLGKQKIFSLAWENNYRYIFTCGNKAKDFL